MASTHDLKSELECVTASLQDVQNKIAAHIEKQEQLQCRKKELETEIRRRENVYGSSTAQTQWSSTDFSWSKELQKVLHERFSITTLREMQLEAMNATLNKQDVILIMPTGGGKSLCFQAPALLTGSGLTLVVSPLISLIEDQLISLRQAGIHSAKLSSTSTKDEVKWVHQQMIMTNPELKLLYVTPEKISKSKRFMAQLEKCYKAGNLSRIAIDEVHCASQWGNDFRPDYKILGIMKSQFSDTPILGLTATSTEKVTQDTKKMLNIPFALVFKSQLNRENIFYSVKTKPPTFDATIKDMSSTIKSLFPRKSGIIYCFSCKNCEEVSEAMNKHGILCASYHAKMEDKDRHKAHKLWLENKIEVLCATVAFGMGINKLDVRFVIHFALSKSIENYYQESGRAGRDGKPCLCLLYYGFVDIFKQSTMVMTEQSGLPNLRKMLEYCQNSTKCRRSVLFSHFGSEWTAKHCHRSCDICWKSVETTTVNTSNCCDEILAVLQRSAGSNERLTGGKLLEAVSGRGKFKTTCPDVKSLPSESIQRVIVYMLLNGYLKEDFHFTPYSTISYLVPGPLSSAMRRKDPTIRLLAHSLESFQQMFGQFSGDLTSGRKRLLSTGSTNSMMKQMRTDEEFEAVISHESNGGCSIDLTKDGGLPILIDDSDDDFL